MTIGRRKYSSNTWCAEMQGRKKKESQPRVGVYLAVSQSLDREIYISISASPSLRIPRDYPFPPHIRRTSSTILRSHYIFEVFSPLMRLWLPARNTVRFSIIKCCYSYQMIVGSCYPSCSQLCCPFSHSFPREICPNLLSTPTLTPSSKDTPANYIVKERTVVLPVLKFRLHKQPDFVLIL